MQFHNSNVFGSCIIHVLYTGCAKIKKKFRPQKVNIRICKRTGVLDWLNNYSFPKEDITVDLDM